MPQLHPFTDIPGRSSMIFRESNRRLPGNPEGNVLSEQDKAAPLPSGHHGAPHGTVQKSHPVLTQACKIRNRKKPDNAELITFDHQQPFLLMKHKTDNNPGPWKKRKSLAEIIFMDMRLLYISFYGDNCLDTDFKSRQTAANEPGKYRLIGQSAMNEFIGQLIHDYRMN